MQQIADAAQAFGRKVTTLGLSMKKNVRLAREMGLLNIPDSTLVDIAEIGDLDPGEICIISTGSQGEPMSALSLMASGTSKWLTIGPDDTIILSSHPIPGNEMNVSKVIDGLVRTGAEVVHSGHSDVHATGHAKAEDSRPTTRSPGPSGSSRCTASTGTSSPTPRSPGPWASTPPRSGCARTATRSN